MIPRILDVFRGVSKEKEAYVLVKKDSSTTPTLNLINSKQRLKIIGNQVVNGLVGNICGLVD